MRTIATNLNSAAYTGYLVSQHMIAVAGRALPERCDGAVAAPGVRVGVADTIGAIVNVSSRGAFRGEPVAWAYGASKGGMNSLTGSMAQALGKYGIVVNAIAPGFVETERVADIVAGPTGAAVAAQSPMNRVAMPEEVAESIVFLSQYWRTPWVTGAILDCNGASYLRS